MVASGMLLFGLLLLSFWYMCRNRLEDKRWLLKACLLAMPLPWIAIECGWLVSEYGRQPWSIQEILPTAMTASDLTVNQILTSLAVAFGLYTVLLIIEVRLMVKYARIGPSALKTGQYHFEREDTDEHELMLISYQGGNK